MFIEVQPNEDMPPIYLNIQTIKFVEKKDDHSAIFFIGEDKGLEVRHSYKEVVMKINMAVSKEFWCKVNLKLLK